MVARAVTARKCPLVVKIIDTSLKTISIGMSVLPELIATTWIRRVRLLEATA
jgi:hypothetical protein